jgi:hypothetical protein
MSQRSTVRRMLAAVTCAVVLLLGACHPDAQESKATGADPGDTRASGSGVTLPQDQVEKLGIVTESAKAADYTAQTAGYGVVPPPWPN